MFSRKADKIELFIVSQHIITRCTKTLHHSVVPHKNRDAFFNELPTCSNISQLIIKHTKLSPCKKITQLIRRVINKLSQLFK